MARRHVAVLLVLVVMLQPYSTADIGKDTPLAVFICYPYEDYDVGSIVNVTVNVFREGDRYDPASVYLERRQMRDEVPLTRVSKGAYAGNFTITIDDIDEEMWIYLDATVSDVPWDSVEDMVVVPLIYNRLSMDLVWLSPLEGSFIPGEDYDFEVRLILDGAFVDPDPGTLYVQLAMRALPGYQESQNLTTTRVGTGRYRSTVSMPEALVDGLMCELGAEALVTITLDTPLGPQDWTLDGSTGYLRPSFDTYTVWCHEVERTSEGRDMELYVIDRAGAAIEGVNLSLELSTLEDFFGGTPYNWTNLTTDVDGHADLFVPAPPEAAEDYTVWISCALSAGTIEQEVSALLTPDPGSLMFFTDSNGIDLAIDQEDFVNNGTELSLGCCVVSEGMPLLDQVLSVYVKTDQEVLASVNITTDGEGCFNLTFPLPPSVEYPSEPSSYPQVFIQALVNGSFCSCARYFLDTLNGTVFGTMPPAGSQTEIDYSIDATGNRVNVTFSNGLFDGDLEVATLMWGIGTDGPYGLDAREWNPWNPDSGSGSGVACEWHDSAYECELDIPDIFPVGTAIYFYPDVVRLDIPDFGLFGPLTTIRLGIPETRPMVIITDEPLMQEDGTIDLEGNAFGDTSILKVDYRVDDGPWRIAEGTASWSISFDATGLPDGPHTFQVRSFDGRLHSHIVAITVDVHRPPAIGSISLQDGSQVMGVLVITGKVTDATEDDNVEYRIDEGTWNEAHLEVVEPPAMSAWSLTIDTKALAHGDHVLEVRASDAGVPSTPTPVRFSVDNPPRVTISSPASGDVIEDDIIVSGTASDDDGVVRVEYRVDNGTWQIASGTSKWNGNVKTGELPTGGHVLSVRSFDGNSYSETSTVDFSIGAGTKTAPGTEPALILLGVLVLAAILMVIAYFRSRRIKAGPG